MHVGPGDKPFARGDTIRITAILRPRYARAVVPTSTTLILTDEDGVKKRLRMTGAEGEFALAHKVTGNFSYQVEAGSVLSQPFQVTAVTRVELVSESPTVTITPPQYARQTEHVQTLAGLVDLSALQHSEVQYAFRFNRSAVAATLEWITSELKADVSGSKEDVIVKTIPLELSPDRLAATFPKTALKTGKYRLLLEAEHGICTELEGGTLNVKVDQPPAFGRTALRTDLRTVLPHDKLPIELEIADDVGVARAEIEYRVNDKPAVENIPLEGANGRIASARHLFALAGKVRPGDDVAYRIKVQDNLPPEFGGPHTIWYPSDRWLTFRIDKKGMSIQEKDILTQREAVNRMLEAIKSELQREQRGIYKLQQETRLDNSLAPAHAEQLKQLQKDNSSTEKVMRKLALDIGVHVPELQPLANKVQNVAEQEMRRAEDGLRTAQAKQKQADERDQQLRNADKEVTQALDKLDDLKKTNEQLAKQRLDQARVEMLADRQKELADRANELANRDPVRDPETRKELERLKQDQADVAQDLEKLNNQSEAVKNALAEARANEANDLAERAEKLAQEQRKLAQEQAGNEKKLAQDRLTELAQKQQELADKGRQLALDTKSAANSARAQQLKTDDAQKAADKLKEGDPNQAAQFQDKNAQELERLASELDRAINLARDPREAAKQLARLQDNLKNRLAQEVKKKSAQPLADRLKPLQREQQALQQAAEQLSVPPQDTQARMARLQAAESAQDAARSLERQEPHRATGQMEQTKQALERLADRLPSAEQRLKEAVKEVARLRQKQEQLTQQTDLAEQQARNSRNPRAEEQLQQKMQQAAQKQADLAQALGKLDAPNQEARLERAQDAANRALADLMDARKEDVQASQQQARRELERLEQALRGQKPADEQARELAQQQKRLAEEAAQAAKDPKATPQQMKELQRRQGELAQQAHNLQAPEAPLQQKEAAKAAQQAADSAAQSAQVRGNTAEDAASGPTAGGAGPADARAGKRCTARGAPGPEASAGGRRGRAQRPQSAGPAALRRGGAAAAADRPGSAGDARRRRGEGGEGACPGSSQEGPGERQSPAAGPGPASGRRPAPRPGRQAGRPQ